MELFGREEGAEYKGQLMRQRYGGVLALAPAMAEARMGGGRFGSSGSRSWSAPPSTRTMPGTASPFERSLTRSLHRGWRARYHDPAELSAAHSAVVFSAASQAVCLARVFSAC